MKREFELNFSANTVFSLQILGLQRKLLGLERRVESTEIIASALIDLVLTSVECMYTQD